MPVPQLWRGGVAWRGHPSLASTFHSALCIIIRLKCFPRKILTPLPLHSHHTAHEDDDDQGRMIGPGYLEDNLEHGAPLPERYVW